MTINIISGDVRGINDVHNTLTVSKYSGDSDNTKQFIPTIPQLNAMGGGNGLIGGQQRIQIVLPTGSVAYDVNNSAFKYVMRFILDLNSPYYISPTSNGLHQPFYGLYTLYQGAWFYTPYTLVLEGGNQMTSTGVQPSSAVSPTAFCPVTGVPIFGTPTVTNATTKVTSTEIGYLYNAEWQQAGESYCLGSGPMNAMCVLWQTQCQYNGMNDDDIRTFRHYLDHQIKLDPHIQDTQQYTWFYGTKPCITFNVLPYVIDQIRTFKDGTPNPRYGTRVPDGRLWNPHNQAGYQSIRPNSANFTDGMTFAPGTINENSSDTDFAKQYYSYNWLYGVTKTRTGTPGAYTVTNTWNAHQYPDLTCGYTYDWDGTKYTPRLTPGVGGMNEIISFALPTSAIGSARFGFVQNVEFSIPMRYLNSVFDTDNPLFYANALRTALFSIWLSTHQQNMCDVWGNSRMFGLQVSGTPVSQTSVITAPEFKTDGSAPAFGLGTVNSTNTITLITGLQSGATTAMVDGFFYSEQKSGNLFNSDLAAQEIIANKTSKQLWTGIGTFTANNSGIQNYPIMRAIKNMQQIMILACSNDIGVQDNGVAGWCDDPKVRTSGSLYLHQHSTMWTEQQFVAVMNQMAPDVEFNWLGDFNIRLSNKPTNYMYQGVGTGLKSIEEFKHETLASSNLLCNVQYSSMPYMFQYGDNCILVINAEKFKNLMKQDISFDGVDTTNQPVMLQWSVWTYDRANYSGSQNIGRPYSNSELQGPPLYENGYIMEVFQKEEEFVIIDPMTGTLRKENDVRGMGLPLNAMMQ